MVDGDVFRMNEAADAAELVAARVDFMKQHYSKRMSFVQWNYA